MSRRGVVLLHVALVQLVSASRLNAIFEDRRQENDQHPHEVEPGARPAEQLAAHTASPATQPAAQSVALQASQPAAPPSPRGSFAEHCQLYPHKRVVLVTVNKEYFNMFRNWFHFAKQFLHSTEQLRVVAEEDDVLAPLQAMQKEIQAELQFDIVRRDDGLDESASLLMAPFGAADFKGLVGQRPRRILPILEAGCSVLYADIDTAWVKDPFLDIAAAGPADLYLTDDDWTHSHQNYCTCFLYMHPAETTTLLMQHWAARMTAPSKMHASSDQPIFNQVVREPLFTEGLKKVLLQTKSFPPGKVADQFPEASIFHANWIVGIEAKVNFMKKRSLWVM